MGPGHGELWKQSEAGSSWSRQRERESERSIRGKGVSGRITGCYRFKEGPHRKQAFRRRDGRALQLAGT